MQVLFGKFQPPPPPPIAKKCTSNSGMQIISFKRKNKLFPVKIIQFIHKGIQYYLHTIYCFIRLRQWEEISNEYINATQKEMYNFTTP